MRLLAPAKINLYLRVGPRSSDGFHPIVSWMCTVGLFDSLTIAPAVIAAATTSPSPKTQHLQLLELRCDDPVLPRDRGNLVVRAAEVLARQVGGTGETPSPSRQHSTARPEHTPLAPVLIDLSKQIPLGGGLGGGSSDAARTLLGLNQFWRAGLTIEQLLPLAAEIGSDVPFFLFGTSSICTRHGERVQPIRPPRPRACVLILPPLALATAKVYQQFDELNTVSSDHEKPESHNLRQWSDLSAERLMPLLVNDLEQAAFDLQPQLARFHEETQDLLGLPVRMSGSGSSLFTLFDEFAAAKQAAEKVRRQLKVRSIAADLSPRIDDDLVNSGDRGNNSTQSA